MQYPAYVGRPAFTEEQHLTSLRRRYDAAVIRNERGCWGWRRRVNSEPGYPHLVKGHGTKIYMHRFSYEIHVGPIPDGMWVLHHCDNKICTRPDHLYLGDQFDNGGDIRARETSLKTHCRRGHEKTPENTYVRIDKKGYVCRYCRACNRAWQRERRARRRS
jgi:hypothetical protein